jgi:hypothetical protein
MWTSSLQSRDAERSFLIIAEHQFRGASRYRKRDVTGDGIAESWCNVHTIDVAEAFGISMPRGLRANGLISWVELEAAKKLPEGWVAVDAHTAQAMADAGQFAVATWRNPIAVKPGHIAPLEPSMGEAGVWISNVGAVNFTRGLVAAAFGELPISFFGHP